MSNNRIETALTHIEELTGSQPTLGDLISVRDLWTKLQRYWGILGEETLRQRAGKQTIRVLDFDIIYPAFWREESKWQMPSNLEARIGFPMTTSFVFENTLRPFTLPPGAMYELATYVVSLESRYKVAGSRLEETIQSLNLERTGEGVTANMAARAIDSSSAFDRYVKKDVNTLMESGARLLSLKRILNHRQLLSWSEVVRTAKAEVDINEVLRLHKLFNVLRPDRSNNNFLDAVNVASYDSLLIRLGVFGSVDSVYPVMASTTRIVLNYRTQTNIRSLARDAIQPVSTQYLSFATAAEMYVGNNIQTLASVVRRSTGKMFELLQVLDAFLFDAGHETYRLPEQAYDSVPLAKYHRVPSFRRLCGAYTEWKTDFARVFENTFVEIARTDEQLNANFRVAQEHLLGKLKGGQSFDLNMEAEEVSAILWNQSTSALDTYLRVGDMVDRAGREGATRSAVTGAGILFSKRLAVRRSNPTLRIRTSLLGPDHFLFSWERAVASTEQMISWIYGADLTAALDNVREFLTRTRQNECLCHIYDDEIYASETVDPREPTHEWLAKIYAVTLSPEYIRIEGNRTIVFFDLSPVADSVSTEMAVLYTDRRTHRAISELFHKSAATPISVDLLVAALDDYAMSFSDWAPKVTAALEQLQDREVDIG